MMRTSVFSARVSATCFLFTALLTLNGCDRDCTAIDEATLTDPLTGLEQAAVEANGYFNLTGDCDTEEVACEELLPETCEAACSEGYTCTQVSLLVEPCGGNAFFPDVDYGDHWIRKCLEVTTSSQEEDDRFHLEESGESEVSFE